MLFSWKSKVFKVSSNFVEKWLWKENRLHCVKSAFIQSFFGPYFPALALN